MQSFLHLADATARHSIEAGITRVGLLGTRYTMEEDFYKERLTAHGVEVCIPDQAGRDEVHRIIYDELCHGVVREESREIYKKIISGLIKKGAQGIVLGCTEIVMLLKGENVGVPMLDTTQIHIEAAIAEIFNSMQ